MNIFLNFQDGFFTVKERNGSTKGRIKKNKKGRVNERESE
jgi:hypothetical protein